MQLLWFILIGIAAGWLAGQIMKGGSSSLVGVLIVGVIGATDWRFSFWSAWNPNQRIARKSSYSDCWRPRSDCWIAIASARKNHVVFTNRH